MPGVFKRKRDRSRKGAAWGIWWHDGHRRCYGVGFADREQSLILARRREDECMKRALGLVDPAAERLAESAARTLSEHAADYIGRLAAKGGTRRHLAETRSYIDRVSTALGWTRLRDIDSTALQEHISMIRRRDVLSSRTVNAYIVAWRGLGRWLVAQHRWPHDPLASLVRAREGADRRRVRRVMSAEELEALIVAAERGPKLGGISGRDRAMLYRVLATTGLSDFADALPRAVQHSFDAH